MFLGNFCYQCADTKVGGDCQTYIKTMARARHYIENPPTSDDEVYEKKKDLYKLFVKNCTLYHQGYPNETLCVIETFEYRGQMNMYMRDCTDGVNFAAEYTDVRRPRADNQTYCERKGDTGTYCVRMCRGNFCNGPFANSASKYLISGILWVIIVLNFISVFKEVHHGM